MRNSNKILILLLVCTFALLGGCKKTVDSDEIKDETIVFKYGDNLVTKGETYIYINIIKQRYESQYGEDVWKISFGEDVKDGPSMIELTKEEVVNEIIKVKTLNKQASQYDISLTEKDEATIKEDAKNFYDGLTDKQKTDYSLTEEKVFEVLKENTIASEVEAKILEDSPVELSDEKARMTTFYDMYFDCYDIDDAGNVTPYDAAKKKKQYENALQACTTLATSSLNEDEDASIEKLAEYYELEHAKERTLSADEILSEYGKNIYDLLYSMKNGDYSTVVESEYGYHVFQMIALTDKDATAANKEILTKKEVDKKIMDMVNEWKKSIDSEFSYPESVDMKVYDTIKIDEENEK